MSKQIYAPCYELYPAKYFQTSPTFNAWVKIFAADVQKLRREAQFHGQGLYFYQNHPLRFIRVVGAIVAIDDINLKYTVLTIDDGSGATLELKIVRIMPTELNPVDTSSNTEISNLKVLSRPGIFEVLVDDCVLEIGTIVKAKGTVSEFRDVKQMELKRIQIVASTNEETQAWAETADYKQKYLKQPWCLSKTEQEKLDANVERQEKSICRYKRKLAEHEVKKAQHRRDKEMRIAERHSRLETRRRKEEVMMNAGALM